MKKRLILFAAMLGIFLSLHSTNLAAADSVGFTINGQSNASNYQCIAPCTVELAVPGGGSYDWDPELNKHGGQFTVLASGNPVTWTYSNPGAYTIAMTNGTNGGGGGVNVIPSDESAPEDIELVSPASGAVPRELEFTTSRRKLSIQSCGGSPCRTGAARVTGPDGNGLYHHFVRLEEAPPQGALSVEAWNTEPQYAVEDTFPITTTGRVDPFTADKAVWKVSRQGSRCVVKFSKGFATAGAYTAKLRLVAKATGVREKEKVRSAGEDGNSQARGKLLLSGSEVKELPAKVTARLKVTTDGQSYRVKDKHRVKAECR